MTQKKIVKKHTKDQEKHSHREAFKGHRTRKHFLSEVANEEAEEDIKNARSRRKYGE